MQRATWKDMWGAAARRLVNPLLAAGRVWAAARGLAATALTAVGTMAVTLRHRQPRTLPVGHAPRSYSWTLLHVPASVTLGAGPAQPLTS